jgi:hypothetical protein
LTALIASLPDFLVVAQNPIPSPPVAQILLVIQLGGIDLTGRAILKTLTVEYFPNLGSFGQAQGGAGLGVRFGFRSGLPMTIQATAGAP